MLHPVTPWTATVQADIVNEKEWNIIFRTNAHLGLKFKRYENI